MIKTSLLLACCLAGAAAACAQAPEPIRLWKGDAPGARGHNDWDIPTVTPYLALPDRASGAAMLICPGGGYAGLAPYEGKGYAVWLAAHGIAGFVLKYRLGSHGYRHPVMLEDVTRAMRLVRARARQWGIDPHRIGVMGSSAGGHLASTLLTHYDAGDPSAADPIERVSSRPDLGVLCYAVITMGRYTHQGSKRNLLGEHPSADLVNLLSNERHVTSDTPPCFIWHTDADPVVPVENSLMFAEALRRAGVPFALHIYERGGHGMGLAHGHPWTRDCLFWLGQHGFLRMP